MTTQAPSFNIELAQSDEDYKAVSEIMLRTFTIFDLEGLQQRHKWLDELNPAGKSLTYLLSDCDKIIGTQCVCLRQHRHNNETITSGSFIDFAVDQSYRSLGPAMQLLKGSTTNARGLLGFLYGFPNAKSAPVFKRAGATLLGHTRRMTRVLKADKYLEHHINKHVRPLVAKCVNSSIAAVDFILHCAASITTLAEWNPDNDVVLDSIWEQADYPDVLISRRDAQTINWRYQNGRKYPRIQKVVFTSKGRQRKPLGYILFTVDIDTIKVLDFFTIRPDTLLATRIWGLFFWEARKFNCTNIFLEFFGPKTIRKALTLMGFVNRDPAPIFTFSGTCNTPENENNWYITHFDRDT